MALAGELSGVAFLQSGQNELRDIVWRISEIGMRTVPFRQKQSRLEIRAATTLSTTMTIAATTTENPERKRRPF